MDSDDSDDSINQSDCDSGLPVIRFKHSSTTAQVCFDSLSKFIFYFRDALNKN